jgi:hypothetical protein
MRVTVVSCVGCGVEEHFAPDERRRIDDRLKSMNWSVGIEDPPRTCARGASR